MDDRDLIALLQDLESDRAERKESISDREKISQAICAFANDLPDHRLPGVLFVGARDDGSCAGLTVTDQLLQTLADMKTNGNIYPFPSIEVQKHALAGGEMAVVTVRPSDAPPVRYKNVTWIRVGPRRGRATPEEEARLSEKRRARDLPFDLRPFPSAKLDDLDLDLFRKTYLPYAVDPEILQQNNRSIEQQLAALRFIATGSDPCPTALGLLVCGKEPQRFLPGAYVQFLRVDGPSLAGPIKHHRQVAGPLPDLLRILDEVFQAHVFVAADIRQTIEVNYPDYPIVAFQQISRNAILHRTYEGTHAPVRITWFSDRIEIQSPGGPFGS